MPKLPTALTRLPPATQASLERLGGALELDIREAITRDTRFDELHLWFLGQPEQPRLVGHCPASITPKPSAT